MGAKEADFLRKAREFIEISEHWSQGRYARSITDGSVPFDSIDAHSFCMTGALKRATGSNLVAGNYANCHRHLWNAMRQMYPEIAYHRTIVDFNDTPYRNHDDILAIYDLAICLAEL